MELGEYLVGNFIYLIKDDNCVKIVVEVMERFWRVLGGMFDSFGE